MALRILFLRHGSGIDGWQIAVDGCSGDAQGFGDLGGTFACDLSGVYKHPEPLTQISYHNNFQVYGQLSVQQICI